MILALLLLACGAQGPVLTGVDPKPVTAGKPVRILGEHFAAGAKVRVAPAGGAAIDVTGVTVTGPVIIEAVVPEDLPGGTYDLTVDVDGRVATLAGGLVVEAVPEDRPCAGEYTANTQLSLARELVVIDRFYRDGKRDTLRVPLREIERVEYELVRLESGELCSVIFMRKSDGKRVMFDDDTEVDLKQRAGKMARDMGKPIDVTREDAPEMGKPVEAH